MAIKRISVKTNTAQVKTVTSQPAQVKVKKITAALPTAVYTRFIDLLDVSGTPTTTNSFIQWNGSSFTFVPTPMDSDGVDAQIDSAFDVKSTSDLSEGTNLYYTTTRVDSAIDVRVDQTFVRNFIDQSFIDTFDTHDSSAIQGMIDVTIAATDTHDSAAVVNQIEREVDQAFINQFDTHDSAAVNGQIDDRVTKAFVDNLNVDADTLDGQHGAYYLDYNNFTNVPVDVFHDSALTQGQIDSTLDGNVTIGGNLTVDGHIAGPSTMIIDPAVIGDNTGTVVIKGQLEVLGNTTTFEANEVAIENKTITLANGATTKNHADGAGFVIEGFTNTTLRYEADFDGLQFNKTPYVGLNRILTTGDTFSSHDSAVTGAQIDSAFGVKSTTDLAEGINLYYTTVRVDSAIDDKVDATFVRGFIDQSFINTFDTHDSAAVAGQITNTVTQSFIDGFDTHDSAAVVAQINAEVDQAFIDQFDTHDSAAVVNQINLEVDQAFINQFDTHDSAAVAGQINSTVDQTFIDGFDTHDSAAVQGQIDTALAGFTSYDSAAVDAQIDSAVNQAFIDQFDTHDSAAIQAMINATLAVTDTHDSAAVLGQINDTVNQAFINQFDTHDSAAVVAQINDEVDQAFINQFDTHDSAAVQGQINSTLAGDITIGGNLMVDGYIGGPSTMTIDPETIGTDSGTLIILGNLQVEGETTTINSTTLSINDKNIVLADSATNAAEANGAGITVNGANATIQYKSSGDKWEFNKAPYYGADRLLTTADDTHDSAAVVGQINAEVDKAFVDNLGVDYTSLSNKPTIPALGTDYVDSAEVNILIAAADTHDSAAVLGQINATVNQSYIDAFDTHDSAAVQGQIDATVNALDTHDSAAVVAQINATVDQTFIDGLDTHDSAAVQGQIDATVNALDTHDSAAVVGQINATVDQAFIDQFDTHDSAAVIAQINATVDQTFIDGFDTHDSDAVQGQIDATVNALDTHDSAAVLGQINATVNQAFIDQFDTHDSAAIQAMIDASDTHDSAAVVAQINAEVDQAFINQFDTHDSAQVVGQINAEVTQFFVNLLEVDAGTLDNLNSTQFLRSDADDTTTGNLTVEGTLTASNLITFEGDSATVTSGQTAVVAFASMSSFNAIEATVVSVNATSGERQVSRVLLTHDTTDTYMNEYAVINTGASDEFTMDADDSAGDFRLKLENVSGNTLFAKASIAYL